MTSFEPYIEHRDSLSEIPLQASGGKTMIIEIGPGTSFGSEHPTTRLCKRGIEEIFKLRNIETVLDFGCGSGILGICAGALGAEHILAMDIDPIAVNETKENVIRNKLGPRVKIIKGSWDKVDREFELVIANLVTANIVSMTDEFKLVLKNGGILLVSGISATKRGVAISGLENAGFKLNREYIEGGWTATWFELLQ